MPNQSILLENTPLLQARSSLTNHSTHLAVLTQLQENLPPESLEMQLLVTGPSVRARLLSAYDLFLIAGSTVGITAALQNLFLGFEFGGEAGEICEYLTPAIAASAVWIGAHALRDEGRRQTAYISNRDQEQTRPTRAITTNRILAGLNAGAGTWNFALDGLIAVVLQIKARNGQRYDINLLSFLAGYLFPTLLIGGAHGYFEYTRFTPREESRLRKAFKHFIHTIAYGSVYNSFIAFIGSAAFNFNENIGITDRRTEIYGASVFAAGLTEFVSERYHFSLDRPVNAIVVTTLLGSLFLPQVREAQGDTLSTFNQVFWPLMLVLSLVLGAKFAVALTSEAFEEFLHHMHHALSPIHGMEVDNENHAQIHANTHASSLTVEVVPDEAPIAVSTLRRHSFTNDFNNGLPIPEIPQQSTTYSHSY